MENTNTKAVRITKAQRFADILAILNGNPVQHGTTIEIANEVINHELELLAKKSSNVNRKPTAAQVKDDEYRTMMLDFLATQSEGVTCTTIQKSIPAFADFTINKVSGLMKALVGSGKVNKAKVKGVTLFTIA
jgi:hypothetical protein